jgi:hypothetical protein
VAEAALEAARQSGIAGVGGQAKIYPGIDIDVPTKRTDKVVLSCEYVEMWLANLSAAGETLREIFARPGA